MQGLSVQAVPPCSRSGVKDGVEPLHWAQQRQDRAGCRVDGWEHILSLPTLASSVQMYWFSTQGLEADEIWTSGL